MRILSWTLAATTLVSGWAMVHFAMELRRQRTAAEVIAMPSPPAVIGVDLPVYSPTTAGSATTPTDQPREAARVAPRKTAAQLQIARQRAERFRDPRVREQELRLGKYAHRASLEDLAPHIDLQMTEIDALAEALAAADVRVTEERLACDADPGCDSRPLLARIDESQEQEMARGLGPRRFEKFLAYVAAGEDRGALQLLRDRLGPANPLEEAAIEQAAMALAEETRRFVAEAEARREHLEEIPGYSRLMITMRSAASAGSAGENRERLESATRYLARREERAAQFLDREHLRAFKDEQARALAEYKAQLRAREIQAAAEEAAGAGARTPAMP
jgi:hypothetical protein